LAFVLLKESNASNYYFTKIGETQDNIKKGGGYRLKKEPLKSSA